MTSAYEVNPESVTVDGHGNETELNLEDTFATNQSMVFDTLAESRPQRWRALADMQEGKTGLIYLGHSLGQIRENYAAAYEDLFAKEAKEAVLKIRIERWDGIPGLGVWMFHSYVPVPRRAEVKLKFGIKK